MDLFGTQHLALFVVSGLLLAITPGQDSLYIIGRSVSQGRRAGLLSVLGIVTGCAVHAVAAAFGLSAILSTSAHAFIAVKMAGAAYLCYRGVQMLVACHRAAVSWRRLHLHGHVVVPPAGLVGIGHEPASSHA